MDGQDQDPITGLLAALFGPLGGGGGGNDGENTTKESVTARLNANPSMIHQFPDFFGAARPERGEVGPAPAPRPLPDPSASGPNEGLPLTAPGGPIFDNRPPGTPEPRRDAPMQGFTPRPPVPQPGAQGAPAPAGGAQEDPYQGFLNRAIPNPDFTDKLARSLSSLQGASGILPALGNFMTTFNNAEPQAALTRAKLGATMRALVRAGASPEEAMAAALDPKAMEKILPTLMPYEAQKAKSDLEKTRAETEKTRFEMRKPVEIGMDPITNQKIFGIPDPSAPGRYISPMTGKPIEAGASLTPTGELPTGEEYLATVPQQVSARMRKVITGEAQLPKGVGARSGLNATIANNIYLADPNYNEGRFLTRQKFLSGLEAQNIKGIEQFAGHMGSIAQSVEGLGNTNWYLLNVGKNALNKQSNNITPIEQFMTDKTAIIEEAARVFKGAAPGVFEAKAWEERLDPNLPTETLRSNVKRLSELVHSRLEALREQWDASFQSSNIPPTSNFLAAEKKLGKSRATVSKNMGESGGSGEDGAATGPAILGAPPEATPPAPSAPPAAGAPGQAPAASGSIPNPFGLAAPVAPADAPAPMEAPAPVAPPPAPEPAAPTGPTIGAPPTEQPGQAPGGPAILGAPPAPAAPQQPPQPVNTGAGAADAATMPTITTTAEINALPVGAYFKTKTQDVFQRIAEPPGFEKVTKPPEAPSQPQDQGPPPAQPPAPPAGGQAQADAGGQDASYLGGLPAPVPGMVRMARGPNGAPIPVRFAGGDPADQTSWIPIDPRQRGAA